MARAVDLDHRLDDELTTEIWRSRKGSFADGGGTERVLQRSEMTA
jgi:hypothetical protein